MKCETEQSEINSNLIVFLIYLNTREIIEKKRLFHHEYIKSSMILHGSTSFMYATQ